VKKYHSSKTVTEEGWQHNHIELRPLNPDYDPIPCALKHRIGNHAQSLVIDVLGLLASCRKAS
jgi:hypothetical protein